MAHSLGVLGAVKKNNGVIVTWERQFLIGLVFLSVVQLARCYGLFRLHLLHRSTEKNNLIQFFFVISGLHQALLMNQVISWFDQSRNLYIKSPDIWNKFRIAKTIPQLCVCATSWLINLINYPLNIFIYELLCRWCSFNEIKYIEVIFHT